MNRLWIACLVVVVLSCTDQGDVPNYLEVLDLQPAPNSTGVDKAAIVSIHFDRGINESEAGKVRIRYVDGTDPVNSYPGCGLTPPIVSHFCVGPFIWKPGRTVEVTIPKEIADPDGHTLRESLVYRFTTAQDTVPFDLVQTQPAQNETISLGSFPIAIGFLLFNDYVSVRESTLAINPPATIRMGPIVISVGRNSPQKLTRFIIANLDTNATYTITIPRTIADYEGQALPRDYHIVFHTRP